MRGGQAARVFSGAAAAFALLWASGAVAADITAEQTALAYDLLKSADPAQPPEGVDPQAYSHAIDVLRQEHIAGLSIRPSYSEKGILERYGKALYLGDRTMEFARDIGHIRDLVDKGNQTELKQALRDLWVKAGRKEPDDKALQPVIDALYGAKGAEPEETQRSAIDKPDHRIDIMNAPAGGKLQVDVVTKNPDGSEKDRTTFQGSTETTPTADGNDLEKHIKLDSACTSTAQTDADTGDKLNGDWKDASGETWKISRSGGQVTLDEKKADGTVMSYTGTYHLGRIAAAHQITKASDIGDDLPGDVREQLATMGISFRVALEYCAARGLKLDGTWSSQHVTYSGMSHAVEKIHDPYDLRLNLKKGGGKVAQGAAKDEIP